MRQRANYRSEQSHRPREMPADRWLGGLCPLTWDCFSFPACMAPEYQASQNSKRDQLLFGPVGSLQMVQLASSSTAALKSLPTTNSQAFVVPMLRSLPQVEWQKPWNLIPIGIFRVMNTPQTLGTCESHNDQTGSLLMAYSDMANASNKQRVISTQCVE